MCGGGEKRGASPRRGEEKVPVFIQEKRDKKVQEKKPLHQERGELLGYSRKE